MRVKLRDARESKHRTAFAHNTTKRGGAIKFIFRAQPASTKKNFTVTGPQSLNSLRKKLTVTAPSLIKFFDKDNTEVPK